MPPVWLVLVPTMDNRSSRPLLVAYRAAVLQRCKIYFRTQNWRVLKTCFENSCCIFGNEDGRPERFCALNHVVPCCEKWRSHIVSFLVQRDLNCVICLVWIKCFTTTAIQQPPKSFDIIAKVKSATKGGCMKHLKGAMRCKIHLKRLEYNFTA